MNTTILLFFLSAAWIVHVIVIYPVILAAIARRRSNPVRKDSNIRSVTAVLAVHNGAPFIRAKLESLLALDYPPGKLDIIVVSDGSTDETESIAGSFASDRVQLVRLPQGGKSSALNAGIARARGEISFFTDVRQPLDRQCLRHLVACFGDEKVGVASGELIIRKGDSEEAEDIGIYRSYENWVRTELARVDSIFGATGCIYAMRRELAEPIPADSLLDDMYLPLAAFFRGYRLIFEPAARAYDYPTMLEAEFRRKVRTLAGNYQIIAQYPRLLTPANRMWFHFMSYKFGRLMLPYCFLIVAASTAWLPAPFRAIAIAAQALLYGAAILDLVVPHGVKWKRLTSPFRTFVVMLAADLCAASILFVPASKLWKPTAASDVSTKA